MSTDGSARDVLRIEPLVGPPDTTVRVPGSKSLTNRVLVCAALADGESVIERALLADDTEAMSECLRRLGAGVRSDRSRGQVDVTGCGGRWSAGPLELDARQSGTTARFLLPTLMLGPGPYHLDGHPSLRKRPMGDLISAVRTLGLDVREEQSVGHLPLVAERRSSSAAHERRRVTVRGDITSQYLTALMLAGPCLEAGIDIEIEGEVVSSPYVHMTAGVMESFGAQATIAGRGPVGMRIDIGPSGYRPTTYEVEPDASSASYFLAAAGITGGRVRVEGLGLDSLQGDVSFLDVLASMGAAIERGDGFVEVRGRGRLRGVDVDLRDMPDMATTLAAIAVFADAPTRVRGVQVIHGHETDRIDAMATELGRAGIEVDQHEDGWTVHPGAPRPCRFRTYDDHRMAMSLSLLGLVATGIEIEDPGCVDKTFPDFFGVLDELRRPGSGP